MIDFTLDKDSKVKLYHQLFTLISTAIESGELDSGTKLPSIRILSNDYGISKNTVTKAYEELEKQGYIYSMTKSGFFVKKPRERIPESRKAAPKTSSQEIPTVDSIMKGLSETKNSQDSGLVYENMDNNIVKTNSTFIMDTPFVLGTEPNKDEKASDLGTNKPLSDSLMLDSNDVLKTTQHEKPISSPEEAYIESYKSALTEQRNLILKPHKKNCQGEGSLRIAIASFIYKFHRINVNPAHIIVGTDLAQLFYNLFSLPEIQHPIEERKGLLRLAESSLTQEQTIQPSLALIEDSNNKFKSIFQRQGFKVTDVLGDESGMTVNSLITSSATIAFTCSEDIDVEYADEKRRYEILQWASATDYRYVIDYDLCTEFHNGKNFFLNDESYDKVIYVNSFKHLISRAFPVSFIALPKKLADSYKIQFHDFDCSLPLLDQCALTDFLIKGKLDNYLRNLEQI